MARNPSFSSPKALMMASIGNRAFNKKMKNDFSLEAEKYNEDEKLRKDVSEREDENRANDFINEIKTKMRQKEKLLKLEIQLLNYIFVEDDGKISLKEKAALNSHFKSYKGKISVSVLKELKDLNMEKSLSDIHKFVETNNYHMEDISSSIATARKITKYSYRYKAIIDKIEQHLVNN